MNKEYIFVKQLLNMPQLEPENLPTDKWDLSSFPDELEFDSLEDLLKDRDLQILANRLIEV